MGINSSFTGKPPDFFLYSPRQMRLDIGLIIFFENRIRFQNYGSDEARWGGVKKIQRVFLIRAGLPIHVPFSVCDQVYAIDGAILNALFHEELQEYVSRGTTFVILIITYFQDVSGIIQKDAVLRGDTLAIHG